jgi:hypothetical protein
MSAKDKLLYFDDDACMKEYMRTGRIISKDWLNGNHLLKTFNPWMYDPERAVKLTEGVKKDV